MLVFNFVTLFPELIEPYFRASILARAVAAGQISPRFFNPREKSCRPHKKVDDYAIGGGAGLILHPQPLFSMLEGLKNSHVIVLTPAGKPFRQNDARRLAKIGAKRELSFVCGRYEGIDERVIERYANEVFSVGDFVLTGGELPALCMADAIARNVPGVIRAESLECESYENSLLEAPAFAKPVEYLHDFSADGDGDGNRSDGDGGDGGECGDGAKQPQNTKNCASNRQNKKNFEKFCAIFTFVKGNHASIAAFKNQLSLCKTKFHRPDLLAAHHYLRKKYEK